MSVPDFILDIANDKDQLLSQVIDWANINSGSLNLEGLQLIAEKCAAKLSTLDAEVEIFPSDQMEILDEAGHKSSQELGPIVIARKRAQANRQILLVGHMDTVFPKDSPFQTCTFNEAGDLHGPGVADMKGGITTMIAALQAFEKSPYRDQIGWTVLLNSDEEIGSHGSARFLKDYAEKSDLGMLYEPSMPDGTFAGARKGSGNFTITMHGRAAHAGREHHLGRNAIAALAPLITAIDTLSGEVPDLTVNVGKVTGGGPLNVVPELAQLSFNVRLAKTEDQAWLTHKLAQIIDQFNATPDYKAVLHGSFSRPPKPMSEPLKSFFDLAAECGQDLGVSVTHVATGGCCDGNNLADAGLVNIDTLGVRGANIHSDKEYMIVDSLIERAQLSALILHKLAQSPDLFPKRGPR
jgi:glutamate carboxypeptidase